MTTLLITIHVLSCVMLILVVLLQAGRGADMGAAFGGASTAMFGSGSATNPLARMTTITAVLFLTTALFLAVASARRASVFDATPEPLAVTPQAESTTPPPGMPGSESAPITPPAETRPLTIPAAGDTAPAASNEAAPAAQAPAANAESAPAAEPSAAPEAPPPATPPAAAPAETPPATPPAATGAAGTQDTAPAVPAPTPAPPAPAPDAPAATPPAQ